MQQCLSGVKVSGLAVSGSDLLAAGRGSNTA